MSRFRPIFRSAVLGLLAVAALIVAFDFASTPASADPLSAGCGASAPIPAGSSRELSLAGRGYILHLPAVYNATRAFPLVLAFHGHGSTAGAFERTTGFNRVDAIVAYPQGAVGGDGQTGWNTGRGIDPATDDIGFTRALVAHLEAVLCVNPARIYAAGFSNGGGFVGILACQSGSPFAAFAIMAGDYVPDVTADCHPGRGVRLLEMHGLADRINPYAGSAAKGEESVSSYLDQWAARNACAGLVTTTKRGVTTLRYTGCSGALVHVRIAGLGHAWPTSRRFNATQAAWAFFQA